MSQLRNVVNLHMLCKLLCAESHTSRNAQLPINLGVIMFGFSHLTHSLSTSSIPPSWQRGFMLSLMTSRHAI